MSEKEFLVRKIENGTVIDHIPAGNGLKVANILNIEKSRYTSVILMDVESKRIGRKDVVKIENRELSDEEVSKIALVAPNATINIIRNWGVVEKKNVVLPKILEGVVKCPNKTCITNSEEITSKFIVEKEKPLKLRCYYCERVFNRGELTI